MLRVEATQFDLPWARRDESLGRLFGTTESEPRLPFQWFLDEEGLVECLAHLDAIRERPAEERNEAFDLGHLLLALDVLVRHAEPGRVEPIPIDPQASALVVSATDLLDQDLSRKWTLRELSGQLCVGPFHLVRQFDRWVGLPPIAYLNRRRAERAAMLLATTADPISSVGADVGWPDPSQFSRRFKQYMGVSPRAYREQSRVHYAARRRRSQHTPGDS
jgi:AraC-like DNA-binding protein